MGACCSRRSNKIAAERQVLKEAISSEVHGLMKQHHRTIATTEHGSIVRLSDGQQVRQPSSVLFVPPPHPLQSLLLQPHPSRMELIQDCPPHLSQLPLAAAPPSLKVVSSTDPTRFFFIKSQYGATSQPHPHPTAALSADGS
jgi:hypothetical protein